MFGMAMNSAKLFFLGQLFKDTRGAILLMAAGIATGAVAGVLVGLVAPLWVATVVAGGVAGFAQPILFKNVKYA